MSRDSRVKLAGITAAVTATAAAGYYAYDQYTKRYPRYQEQLDMYKEVRRCAKERSAVGGYGCFLRCQGCRPGAGPGGYLMHDVSQKADAVPDWGGVVFLPALSVVLLQYEHRMLPPRLEMEKLEDDIVKQVHKVARLVSPHHPQRLAPTLAASSCQHPSNLRPCVWCAACALSHHAQMHDGLDKSSGSSILMLPTHVLKLPTG